MAAVRVRLEGVNGLALAEKQLLSLYASNLEFEPDERRLRVLPDGTVELQVECMPYMLHAKLDLPGYGNIWVTADNFGEGYRGDFVDFVSEAVRCYLAAARRLMEGEQPSVQARGHLLAAEDYEHMANRGRKTGENRLYALSHAVFAAELALFERSRRQLAVQPRTPDNLLLGCNIFRYTTGDAPYAKRFANAFNFATLPFYPGRTVRERGQYDYRGVDPALQFLEDKGIRAKGHPLWFGAEGSNPAWLKALKGTELVRAAEEIARHHVRRYKGRIAVWDVINEAHDWANCFELSQEEQLQLTRILSDATKDEDPGALRVANSCLPFAEYVAGRYCCHGALPERLLSPLQYYRRLLERGVDFDAIGIQLYFPARDMLMIHRMLSIFASLGKPVHITEMGVNGGSRPSLAGTEGSSWSQLALSEGSWQGGWNEGRQADWLEQFYSLAASMPQVQALTWWDFIEPSFFGNGALLYEDETPREIYFRLLALKDRIYAPSQTLTKG